MKKVSILIPLYNSEAFISQTIESALGQTWENKEVIVVDDGSKDNSFLIAKEYEKFGVKVFSQSNSGAAAARNRAFNESSGDFIQYLDADDLLSPNKIEEQIRILEQLPKGYISSCPWGHFTINIEESRFLPNSLWSDFSPTDWLITAWDKGSMMQTASWLTPRQLIENAGHWNTKYRTNPADDGEFFCRVILKSNGVKFCKSVKVYYRVHSGSRLSQQATYEAASALLFNCESYAENILLKQDTLEVRKVLAKNYALFIYNFYPNYPDLIETAILSIKNLGITTIPIVGGKNFKMVAYILGFKNALQLRSYSKYKNY